PSNKSWGDILTRFSCESIYQTFGWGEIQRVKGWSPYRFVLLSEDGEVISAVQFLSKNRLGLNVVWIPGGFAGDLKNLNHSFRTAVKKLLKSYVLYIRINIQLQSDKISLIDMQNNGWTKPIKKMTSELSMMINLSGNEEDRLILTSKNWRHNLRRSKKKYCEIKRVYTPNIDELLKLYTEMEKRKKIHTQFTKKQIVAIFENLNSNLYYYECRDSLGDLIAIRAIAVANDMGWDLLAASNLVARKQYATYAIIWKIFSELKRCGVNKCDLGGIDPKYNPGVYNFKKGIGATEINYLGEYEWSNSALFKYLIPYVI
ncbi:peptidoglycan bridge formation glycyltransferase FemA/FemB family protein, partial [Deltaproteobacteria bacterium]|nr:peptidoglycan bridge formation glycyltransferase FemA/FemB family protein [Deltaproteobacteria bacterium]